jgi:quinol monooxygenase YgiN
MGLRCGVHPAPGILFHWVEAVQGGLVVHEIWESEDQFEDFLEEHLQPMSAALGTEEPEVDIRPVASYRRPV